MFSKKYKNAIDNALCINAFTQDIFNAFLKSERLINTEVIDEVLYSVLEKSNIVFSELDKEMIKQALDDIAASLIALIDAWAKTRGWRALYASELNNIIYSVARIGINGVLQAEKNEHIIQDAKINFLEGFFLMQQWTEGTMNDFCKEILTPFLDQQRSLLWPLANESKKMSRKQ